MVGIEYRELPTALYTAAEVRELDRIAIEQHGVPGFELMRRAGRACYRWLCRLWPGENTVTVYCGAGNNGGDGFVIATQALLAGKSVRVILTAAPERLSGSALEAYRRLCETGLEAEPFASAAAPTRGVVVDAILGTGLGGSVRGVAAQAIDQINGSDLPVLAVDIPSGLCSDSGSVLGAAVRARATCTFIGLKRGLFTGSGPAHTGAVHFDDLALPDVVTGALPPTAELMRIDDIGMALGRRPRDAHKGNFGHVLVVGGDHGMAGAAAMAAEAAGRVGAGLVSVATRPDHVAAVVARRPEVMVSGVNGRHELEPLLTRPTVIAVGPGLGQSAWSEQMLHRVLASELPLVVDADALNLLAGVLAGAARERRGNWILTPHPGEAARLLQCDSAAVQADRFAAAAELAARYRAVVVLKGAGSLVASDGATVTVCPYGNPGMASGGMGDVLTGVIGGLVAQRQPLHVAARLGVLVHALAADRAAEHGERGLLAGDVLASLCGVVNP